jgi:outer membrane protein assembly factor BamB
MSEQSAPIEPGDFVYLALSIEDEQLDMTPLAGETTQCLVGAGHFPALERDLVGRAIGDRGTIECISSDGDVHISTEVDSLAELVPTHAMTVFERLDINTVWELMASDPDDLASASILDPDRIRGLQTRIDDQRTGTLVEYEVVAVDRWYADTQPGDPPRGSTWPTFRGDSARTGTRPTSPARYHGTWRSNVGGEIQTPVAVATGTVYVTTARDMGTVHAIDAGTGELRWTKLMNDAIKSSPAVMDGTVYFGSDDGCVYAVNAVTDAIEWEHSTDRRVRSTPAIESDTVYIGSGVRMCALDSETGAARWEVETDGLVETSPAVVDDTVYGQTKSNLYAVDATSGTPIWTVEIDVNLPAAPAVYHDTVYVGGQTDAVFAVDAETGEVQWTHDADTTMQATPAVTNECVYAVTGALVLSALDRETGEQVWSFTAEDVITDPAVADGRVFLGSADQTLYALDAETGTVVWQFECDGKLKAAPVVVDGTVIIGSIEGTIYAIDATTGEIQ